MWVAHGNFVWLEQFVQVQPCIQVSIKDQESIVPHKLKRLLAKEALSEIKVAECTRANYWQRYYFTIKTAARRLLAPKGDPALHLKPWILRMHLNWLY